MTTCQCVYLDVGGGTNGFASGFRAGGGEELLRKDEDEDVSPWEAAGDDALADDAACALRPAAPATGPCM